MAKVQSDFYFRWAQSRIQATYTADQVLDSKIEYVKVDTTSGAIQITLPDASGADVVNGKKIFIIDQGDASTNHITVIPNPSDSTTINGFPSQVIAIDNLTRIYELVEDVWIHMNFRGFNNQTAVSSTYTALYSDNTILGDTSGGAFTINLPTAVGAKGKRFMFKKVFGSAPQLTIDPFGTETIDTALTVSLTGSGGPFIEIESDGTNWFRIG